MCPRWFPLSKAQWWRDSLCESDRFYTSVPRYKTNQKSTTEVKQKWSETAAFLGDAEACVKCLENTERGLRTPSWASPARCPLRSAPRGPGGASLRLKRGHRAPSLLLHTPALSPVSTPAFTCTQELGTVIPQVFLFFVCNNQVRYCYIPFIHCHV